MADARLCWVSQPNFSIEVAHNDIIVSFTVGDEVVELGQPVRHTLEAGDIAGNVLVNYEADASVTSVAALVVKSVATCVECKQATFSLPSCFTNSDNVELYPGYVVFKLCDSVIRGE